MSTATITRADAVVAFASRLSYSRQARGPLTQLDLARRSGLAHGMVSRLERGHVEAKSPTIAKLSHGLDVPLEWMLDLRELGPLEDVPSRHRPGPPTDRDALLVAFAARVREARGRAGLTLGELADAAGIWGRTVIAYEQAAKLPHLANLHRLAAALNVPSAWLLGGGDPPWHD